MNVTGDYKGVGDIAHIAVQATAYTVNDVGSDGALTTQDNVLTDVSLTVDKKKDVTLEVLELPTNVQAFQTRFKDFPDNAGQALREKIESDILNLVRADITQAQGDGLGNLGEDELLAAIMTLAQAKLPILKNPSEFTFAFQPEQFPPLKKSGMIDFNRTGQAGNGGAASMGLPALYNIPTVFTNQVESSASVHYNVLLHRDAFAWAAQKMPTFLTASGLANAKLTRILHMHTLYGIKTVVAARAVILKSKDA